MIAIILLAGYGSRLGRDDLPHKVFLPFDGETLLSRHLHALQTAGVSTTRLVVGHNKESIKEYVAQLSLSMKVECVDNDVYMTTGNTLSLVMGLDGVTEDALVLDGDVLYPKEVFQSFVRESQPSSFAVVHADIDDAECAKVLVGSNGSIAHFITKRLLTDDEKKQYRFAGEAIGFFTLTPHAISEIHRLYKERESFYRETLWEILFTEVAKTSPLTVFPIEDSGCFEIDTREDYQNALSYFEENRSQY